MKRIVLLFLGLVFVGLIFGGCGDTNPSTTNQAAAFQPRYGIYRSYSAAGVFYNATTTAHPNPLPR